jgi:hypothetical protein
MTILRRFLVIQALLLWQGGFLFYAAVVVPIGTDVHGSFEQGRLTRHVTDWMNLIGAAALIILAWDQLSRSGSRTCRRGLWGTWLAMLASLAALALLHVKVESYIDFSGQGGIADYAAFYSWHRVYLYIATGQWLVGLAYVVLLLRDWRLADHRRVGWVERP